MSEVKEIRFITSDYEELFRIPDGGSIVVTRPANEIYANTQEQWVGKCKYLDETHVEINGKTYHICQFAEINERIGATVAPDPNPEVIEGYRITKRIFVGDKTFKLAHNPKAVEPYVTWVCFTTEQDRNNLGHYWRDWRVADLDLFYRTNSERTGIPYDHRQLHTKNDKGAR